MQFVHAHPELGHEEHECSRYLCDTLARVGLEVEGEQALYAHPEFVNTVSLESLWMRRDRVTVFGSRSLSGAEQAPLTAARAAIDAERPGEVMLERLVLDGDVEEKTAFGAE